MTMLFCVLAAIVAGVIGFFIGRDGGSHDRLAECIRSSSDFDFRSDEELKAMAERSGGVGEIAAALLELNENMAAFGTQIRQATDGITADVSELIDATNKVNDDSSDNSATSEELAAAMEETAASTQTISEVSSVMASRFSPTPRYTFRSMSLMHGAMVALWLPKMYCGNRSSLLMH